MRIRATISMRILAAGCFLSALFLPAHSQDAYLVTPQGEIENISQDTVVGVDSALIAEPLSGIRSQSPIFLDTMGLSKMSAISIVAPGFSQLYNRQYWKIPVLYGTVGGFTYLTINSGQKYRDYKKQYDEIRYTDGATRAQIDPVQTKMIRYKTQRDIFLMGAALSYLYFLGDGVLNYPHPTTTVKKATTLAMIFPGAGQIYNKSYWKVPIVVGTFATMAYVIDWNSRGYNRFRDAYNRYPNDEFKGVYSENTLSSIRDQYRRNRDLSIILTGALWILSVVEAHVDAYMKDYDISDDLSLSLEPALLDVSDIKVETNTGHPGFGVALKLNF